MKKLKYKVGDEVIFERYDKFVKGKSVLRIKTIVDDEQNPYYVAETVEVLDGDSRIGMEGTYTDAYIKGYSDIKKSINKYFK